MREIALKPTNQAIAIAALMVILLLIFRILSKPETCWNSTVILILAFCLLNAIAGVFVTNIWVYLLTSIAMLILLLFASFTLSPVISEMSYEKYGSNAAINLAPILYYPVFLVIMGIVRLFISK